MSRIVLSCLFSLVTSITFGQSISFENYNPTSTLVVPGKVITKAKFPFIDVHNHQMEMPTQDLQVLLSEMNKLNMAVMINLSGRGFVRNVPRSRLGYSIRGPEHLEGCIKNIKATAPNRFMVFTNLNFHGFDNNDWTDKTVAQLVDDVKAGASGLKIYKDLGLELKDVNNKRIPVNHSKLDAIWRKCGELGIPVIIHSGEPIAFFQPIDSLNERWLEMKKFPSRARPQDEFPSWEQVMSEQYDIFKRFSKTTFIAAHFSWRANDLDALGKLLDNCPNVYPEIAAIVYELGRQPKRARKFFVDYQDRILFGKDSWNPQEYYTYFRVLESDDEYFPYDKKYHAFWRMYGLNLPDDILRKVYYKNALKLFPQIDRKLFPVD